MPKRAAGAPEGGAAPKAGAGAADQGALGTEAAAAMIEELARSAGDLRELFWQNAVREILTGLATQIIEDGRPLDGRIGIITKDGHRLGVASVMPAFACSVPGNPVVQALSMAVESSVFRILTPQGEVYLLPLSEIRGLHTLRGGLLRELEQDALRQHGSPLTRPFGFAAFTAAARRAEEEEDRRREERRRRRTQKKIAPPDPTE